MQKNIERGTVCWLDTSNNWSLLDIGDNIDWEGNQHYKQTIRQIKLTLNLLSALVTEATPSMVRLVLLNPEHQQNSEWHLISIISVYMDTFAYMQTAVVLIMAYLLHVLETKPNYV